MLAKSNSVESEDFPFKTYLSLLPILDFWQKESEQCSFTSELKEKIASYIEQFPELAANSIDPDKLKEHEDFIIVITSAFFTRTSSKTECRAVLLPFSKFIKIHATEAYHALKLTNYIPSQARSNYIEIIAYTKILQDIYGIDLNYDQRRFILEGFLPGDTFPRFWEFNMDLSFVRVRQIGGQTTLSQEERIKILESAGNLQVWRQMLPPENYQFEGLNILTFADVNYLETLSRIKQILIDRGGIIEAEKFNALENLIRRLFKDNTLKIHLSTFLPKEGGRWELVRYRGGLNGGIRGIYDSTFRFEREEFERSIFCYTKNHDKMMITPDMQALLDPCGIDNRLIADGLRNVAIFPLLCDEQKVGFLDVSSDVPGLINDINIWKLDELNALFAKSVKALGDSLRSELDFVIRKNCTVIHPSVEWRFQEAAIASFSRQNRENILMEDIVFNHVYPLFGLSDIRGSSVLRNQSIKEDLCVQLELAKSILQVAARSKDFDFLDEMVYRIDQAESSIKRDVDATNEVAIVNFLKNDVESVLETIRNISSEVENHVAGYFSAIDQNLRIIYQKRKAFDNSIKILNSHLCDYLDRAQILAQKVYPHYFEKQATDGVDHNIYIGPGLINSHPFSIIYLKNIRLWQLKVICACEAISDILKISLPMPLSLAHLLIVQNNPISIGFDYDEKKFGVDGAYNIRYEIVKKRIDKAKVKGTNERLTQPEKIAIVYSQDGERSEYMEYIEYLEYAGWLKNGIEELVLEDLQGVHGLKALRIQINIEKIKLMTEIQDFFATNERAVSLERKAA